MISLLFFLWVDVFPNFFFFFFFEYFLFIIIVVRPSREVKKQMRPLDIFD